MSANDRTYKYSVSFNDEASRNLRVYDQNNTTLFEPNNPYKALNDAMSYKGLNLKDIVVDLKRKINRENGTVIVSLELELSNPIPRNVSSLRRATST